MRSKYGGAVDWAESMDVNAGMTEKSKVMAQYCGLICELVCGP